MNFPDRQIISRVTQGDESAFNQVYTYFQLSAFDFCTAILKDEEEAACIIRDVFAKIWEERSNLCPEDNFQAYLFINLRNQIFGQMKKYTDAGSREKYLSRIHARAGKK